MKKLVVFGVGAIAEVVMEKIDFAHFEILGFVNPYTFNTQKIKEFRGYSVMSIEELKGLEVDVFLIASGNVSVVKERMRVEGLDCAKACAFIVDNENDVFFTELTESLNNAYVEFLNWDLTAEVLKDCQRNILFPVTMQFSSNESVKDTRDFVRYKSLELLAKRINEAGLEGAVAECGVYKGEFARKINEFFPHRDLYLFDTFEGFDLKSIADKDSESMCVRFSDGSVNEVLAKMPFRERCIVKKGFFPQTFDLNESVKFVFVSLDMDLYEPILDGLRTFYPRLQRGGVICVHDYINDGYKGCKEAVDLFCKENGLFVVPLADFFGSVLLMKP